MGAGRPPLPAGTYGKISFLPTEGGSVLARARFRDFDGRTRQVSRSGASRAAAERALEIELSQRQGPDGEGMLSGSSRVSTLVDMWLAADHGWSVGTERTYRSTIKNSVLPALGELRLREVTPGRLARALTAIGEKSGPGSAKTARVCLSSMFAMAVVDGAVSSNPVRDAGVRVVRATKTAPRALTPAETTRLVEYLATNDRAVALDLPDVVDWMLATGARIGEALALHAGPVDGRTLLDLDAGTWEVAGTVSCTEGPWSWVTSRTFRKTVATRLEEAGSTPRQVADQLGHANPSMTLDVYFGCKVVSAEAATVLGR